MFKKTVCVCVCVKKSNASKPEERDSFSHTQAKESKHTNRIANKQTNKGTCSANLNMLKKERRIYRSHKLPV